MPPGAKACFDRLTQSRYVSADFSIFSMEGETVMDSVEIVEADLDLGVHQKAVLDLVGAYARDPMGNGGPLPNHGQRRN